MEKENPVFIHNATPPGAGKASDTAFGLSWAL